MDSTSLESLESVQDPHPSCEPRNMIRLAWPESHRDPMLVVSCVVTCLFSGELCLNEVAMMWVCPLFGDPECFLLFAFVPFKPPNKTNKMGTNSEHRLSDSMSFDPIIGFGPRSEGSLCCLLSRALRFFPRKPGLEKRNMSTKIPLFMC